MIQIKINKKLNQSFLGKNYLTEDQLKKRFPTSPSRKPVFENKNPIRNNFKNDNDNFEITSRFWLKPMRNYLLINGLKPVPIDG